MNQIVNLSGFANRFQDSEILLNLSFTQPPKKHEDNPERGTCEKHYGHSQSAWRQPVTTFLGRASSWIPRTRKPASCNCRCKTYKKPSAKPKIVPSLSIAYCLILKKVHWIQYYIYNENISTMAAVAAEPTTVTTTKRTRKSGLVSLGITCSAPSPSCQSSRNGACSWQPSSQMSSPSSSPSSSHPSASSWRSAVMQTSSSTSCSLSWATSLGSCVSSEVPSSGGRALGLDWWED